MACLSVDVLLPLQPQCKAFSKVCPVRAVRSRREEAPQDGSVQHMAGMLWHIANRPALTGPLVSIKLHWNI